MRLDELAKEINAVDAAGRLEADALDVTHDSRAVAPGWAFVAIRGYATDAHRFIPQALAQGAVAVISEQGRDETVGAPAWLQVTDARAALAEAAAAVHGHPSRQLKLVGVTGTNGKTTTAHLVDAIIRAAEGTSAMFGTISHRVGREEVTAQHTTPEASDIQRMLARAAQAGCRSAVMEVSSHAIDLRRARGLHLAAAVFTNLTRDHLDYHKTMEDYFAAKAKLFDGGTGSAPLASVINIDDEYGRQLLKIAQGRVITYGLDRAADVTVTDQEAALRATPAGLDFEARTPAGRLVATPPLVGRPHVYNTLAAIAAGLALGFETSDIASGLALCARVPGRFELVTLEGARVPFMVVVDYAHTDDALRNVLRVAREVAGRAGRVITVFGCGGDRDRTKRAPMGEVAATLSHLAIVTSDNPRSEDPEAIIADAEVGLRRAGRPYVKQTDRREAIFRAIGEARASDVVVIAGKGHETYQILGDRTIHFDDREVAREALREVFQG